MAPEADRLPVPTFNVSPERFREQVTALVEQGFSIWPLRRLIDCHRRHVPVPARTIVITFDDGYESVYRYAWPVLRELRLPATIFLATAYLDSDSAFPFDDWGRTHGSSVPKETFRPLTVAQCREMAASGLIDLGGHTHTHRDLRSQPEEFRTDLEMSIQVIRSTFGARDVTFAFPFGRRHLGFAGDGLVAAARQTRVLCGLTTDAILVDPRSDPFQWGRFNVYDWDTGSTLAAKLAGWYSWAPALQGWAWRKWHPVTGELPCS